MKTALGESFVAKCKQTMTIEQLHCEMRAHELSAASDCMRTAAAN